MVARKQRIGIFGGTFDPIHAGHLSVAQQVARELDLDHVVMVPAGRPPHKSPRGLAPAGDRLEMTRLAVRGLARLRVSDVEVRRTGTCYTIDTVRELKRTCGAGTRLLLILGEDSVGELPTWKDAGKLVEETGFAIVHRPRCPPADFEKLAAELGPTAAEKLKESVVKIREPADVSSTEIRRRVRRGESISGLVRAEVEDYIKERGLYRE